MSDVNDWRGKDDADLTADDIDAMLDAGQPVEVTGPRTVGNGVLVSSARTYGAKTIVAEPPTASWASIDWIEPAKVSHPVSL